MGTSETITHDLADELGNARVVKVRQDAAGTEFLRCYFPMEAWSQKSAGDDRAGAIEDSAMRTAPRLLKLPMFSPEPGTPGNGSEDSRQESELKDSESVTSDGKSKKEPASRFSKQVCTDYARARQR